MHHYIKNGKPFDSPDPIYYFEWIVKMERFHLDSTEQKANIMNIVKCINVTEREF